MQMNANEIGKKLGIGVRVARRIAQQRAQEAAKTQAANSATMPGQPEPVRPAPVPDYGDQARQIGKNSRNIARAAGRGVGGFLRPFGRVGGILWLEVTGFFFGLVALYFSIDLWRNRAGYASGPQHIRFLIDAGLTIVFSYFCVSAFWRAKQK